MARRSTRWMGFFVSAAFATAAVALLTAGGHAWALPGSSMPQAEMDDLVGACSRYLICDTTTGALCQWGFNCTGTDCYFNSECLGCDLGVRQGFCSPAGAGFFDKCVSTTLNCGLTKYGTCETLIHVSLAICVCLVTHSDVPTCTGANCLGGC